MKFLKAKVYLIFSDTVMIGLALLIIPVAIAQNFLKLTPQQQILISIIDWAIWIAFFLEFFLKLTVEERKVKWLVGNWFDNVISITIIVSPILEHASILFAEAPLLRLLRLTRLTRLTRLIRIVALVWRTKRTWQRIDLKIYVVLFLIIGVGFIGSFFATKFNYQGVDITWFSMFVQILGIFYAVLISFFVIHVWSKFNTIGSEIAKEVNSLRNVYLLTKQLFRPSVNKQYSFYLNPYLEEIIKTLWQEKSPSGRLNQSFLSLLQCFKTLKSKNETEAIFLDNIVEELRTSSAAQANLLNLSRDKTPKILWLLLLLLTTIFIGSFIFFNFQNQLLATAIITSISTLAGLVVALVYDMDTPFRAGFWNISPKPYLELKKFVEKK